MFFFSVHFVWNSTFIPRTFPQKVRNLINRLFFLLPCIHPENKRYTEVPKSTYLKEHPSSPILPMRSTHMYKHITSLGIFKVHIPHPNISAASSVSDEPSPLTATCLNIKFSPKFKLPKLCDWGTEWGCASRWDRSYLHMTMQTPVLPPCNSKMRFWGRTQPKPRFISVFRDSEI